MPTVRDTPAAALAGGGGDRGSPDRDLCKRLWLRVARHVVQQQQQQPGAAPGGTTTSATKDAIAVLRASAGVLHVEDVLVFFPDLTLIDDFKDEVAEALQQSDASIADLRREMRDYRDAAERVRADIRALRNRCGVVRPGQKCELCGAAVLSELFYLFACGHAFHRRCLLAEVARTLGPRPRERLERQLAALGRVLEVLGMFEAPGAAAEAARGAGGGRGGPGGRAGGAPAAGPFSLDNRADVAQILGVADSAALPTTAADFRLALQAKREDLQVRVGAPGPPHCRAHACCRCPLARQAEVDGLVASECVYCGDAMISSIAEPFGVAAGPPTGRRTAAQAGPSSLGDGDVTLDDDWEI